MDVRKVTSLTLLPSFLVLVLTSIVLGLSKTQWGDILINSGFLFLAAGLVHLGYNWKS